MAVFKMMNSSGTGENSELVRPVFPIPIGCLFVLAGFGQVYFPALICPYFGDVALIMAGTWFLFRAATRHDVEKTGEEE